MQLAAAGHPLHTRALSVVFTTRADGKLDVHGVVLDLRKRGVVPVAGELQGAGIIHDMHLTGLIDPASAVLETIAADQRSIAFEATPLTEGESCRDPIERVRALAGTRLDGGWARRVGEEIGGPRGCSHLVTLGHLLGSTAAWMLAREEALHGVGRARRPGERVFRRDLVIDGQEPTPGRLQLAAQLGDLHCAPAPAIARPMERFAAQHEVRLLAELDFPALAVASAVAAERRRGPDDLERAPWRERPDVVAPLLGERLGPGITGALLRRIGDAPDDRPLFDVLLNLAPAVVQCAAAMLEAAPVAALGSPSLVGMGGLPDSCFMWRRDGALARARAAEIASTTRRS
jgi:hypothetical protein